MATSKQMAQHMLGLLAVTMADFSFSEGYAIFQSMADVLKHIEETNGELPNDLDAELLRAKLEAYLNPTAKAGNSS
jgi:hypothetical protein